MSELDPVPTPVAAPARDRLGRSHQLRVDIAIAFSLIPSWLRRALTDRNDEKARGARAEIVERIAVAIERRFRVTWHGSDDQGDDALPVETATPLFGGPAAALPVADPTGASDAASQHNAE